MGTAKTAETAETAETAKTAERAERAEKKMILEFRCRLFGPFVPLRSLVIVFP